MKKIAILMSLFIVFTVFGTGCNLFDKGDLPESQTTPTTGTEAETEKAIASIGKYKITEKVLWEYMLTYSLQNDVSSVSCEDGARMYGENQIMRDEIAGTSYDISESREHEIFANEEERFVRNHESILKFCQQTGLRFDDYKSLSLQLMLDAEFAFKHFTKVIDEYIQKEKEKDENYIVAVDEGMTFYKKYMEDKLNVLEYKSLDDEKTQALEEDVPLLHKKALEFNSEPSGTT